ncbi:unnamed protein product [Citrullus colocynthis]|uniref:Uncharacterized protein n=1 Tax=Citrullus colocynthis TaxID=252529 RepID=A0ABP0YV60_9ROSI
MNSVRRGTTDGWEGGGEWAMVDDDCNQQRPMAGGRRQSRKREKRRGPMHGCWLNDLTVNETMRDNDLSSSVFFSVAVAKFVDRQIWFIIRSDFFSSVPALTAVLGLLSGRRSTDVAQFYTLIADFGFPFLILTGSTSDLISPLIGLSPDDDYWIVLLSFLLFSCAISIFTTIERLSFQYEPIQGLVFDYGNLLYCYATKGVSIYSNSGRLLSMLIISAGICSYFDVAAVGKYTMDAPPFLRRTNSGSSLSSGLCHDRPHGDCPGSSLTGVFSLLLSFSPFVSATSTDRITSLFLQYEELHVNPTVFAKLATGGHLLAVCLRTWNFQVMGDVGATEAILAAQFGTLLYLMRFRDSRDISTTFPGLYASQNFRLVTAPYLMEVCLRLFSILLVSVSSNRQSARFPHGIWEVDGSNPSRSDCYMQGYVVGVLMLGSIVTFGLLTSYPEPEGWSLRSIGSVEADGTKRSSLYFVISLGDDCDLFSVEGGVRMDLWNSEANDRFADYCTSPLSVRKDNLISPEQCTHLRWKLCPCNIKSRAHRKGVDECCSGCKETARDLSGVSSSLFVSTSSTAINCFSDLPDFAPFMPRCVAECQAILLWSMVIAHGWKEDGIWEKPQLVSNMSLINGRCDYGELLCFVGMFCNSTSILFRDLIYGVWEYLVLFCSGLDRLRSLLIYYEAVLLILRGGSSFGLY